MRSRNGQIHLSDARATYQVPSSWIMFKKNEKKKVDSKVFYGVSMLQKNKFMFNKMYNMKILKTYLINK